MVWIKTENTKKLRTVCDKRANENMRIVLIVYESQKRIL